jgi:ketosteroid isomerase-like protein
VPRGRARRAARRARRARSRRAVAALCVAEPATQLAGASPAGSAGDEAHHHHGKRWHQLQQTLRETDAAIHAITSGDPQPYIVLWDDSPEMTLFGAWGPIERGPDALRETFEWVGGRFGPGGGLSSENTVVQMSGSLAYTVGFERGMVHVDGGPLVPMTIRVSHTYRYTRGQSRLMHRHADFPRRTSVPRTRRLSAGRRARRNAG